MDPFKETIYIPPSGKRYIACAFFTNHYNWKMVTLQQLHVPYRIIELRVNIWEKWLAESPSTQDITFLINTMPSIYAS